MVIKLYSPQSYSTNRKPNNSSRKQWKKNHLSSLFIELHEKLRDMIEK